MGKDGRGAFQRAASAQSRLWFVANVDGRVNGQVLANRKMLQLLESRATVIRFRLGATAWQKVLAALSLLGTALRSSPTDRVYLSLPGQRGAWLLLAALTAFRLSGAHLFLHHHSYRGLRARPTWLGRALARAAGPNATHILLSEAMATAFAARYGAPGAVLPVTLSNAALLPRPPAPVSRSGPTTIGFLGAWTQHKGVGYFVRLAERLLLKDDSVRIAIAGAAHRHDEGIAADIAAVAARWPGRVVVQGWRDELEKAAFFERLDCLLLPSCLPDEAEPLTMLEALSAGVDVLATPLGAIPERIRSPECLLTLDLDADLDRISHVIAQRRTDRDAATAQCRDHAFRLHRASLPARDLLLARLTDLEKPGLRPGHATISGSCMT
ncbi:glycosyltransferase involved in cell wall biosynthesis [Rhizobium sp. SG_E_25_P2]|uniref:glycosyltransferase n=1 Tax=Rhizobium sp. SG_E_25_P2 TaxID=2879942 RepID=UPI002475EC27|nr:glycosyltransferase [Rhizobium sp. SG_E_25_P2]MDH6266889.1 glycosyltransferase involved in cell wall biosynthesis [Rhizobium sp. SG_E_25_P2]